ncbi:hypothetical protein MYCTH_2135772 [Thermothelomyces thermophilus ATCC 42464]|uniref:SCP domain-containing protein n=1 Tax=Thermothelomyces thermophilus (strain ATCC 42464 / BCRC 31852 / DSM 1799) TaxID=573729 RepID=G2QMK1_THET4|nr:uncharacterized protein MYCTH_2135772 [Thermothelomyces thermophilus ATCC 42464]AEO61181.1 hypothetical protein MYCTH_2135772 [Thermothelomyces thermophilus ATCC 42464]
MKSSIFLAGCGAILAAASPILQDRRLYFETDIVTKWVTVTVTEGDQPTILRVLNRPHRTKTITRAEPSTTSSPPPPPPSTSSLVVQDDDVPTATSSPKPPPTTSSVVESPKPVEPSPEPAPVSSEPASAPAPSSTKEVTVPQPSDYASTAVYHHNVHRSNHSASALTWSDEHAGYAKTLAERCVFAHDTSIGGGGYGQNLAMWGSSGDPEAVGATTSVARAISDGWYNDELELFPASDYGKDNPDMSNFEKWGHFSQLVWKGTEKVGCYTNFCAPGTLSSYGSWYTVCNYYPAGNVAGAYAKNVLPPEGQAVVKAA